MDPVVNFFSTHPEALALLLPLAAQLLSWAVKVSPWGWDDSLLGWIRKNQAGIKALLVLFGKGKK